MVRHEFSLFHPIHWYFTCSYNGSPKVPVHVKFLKLTCLFVGDLESFSYVVNHMWRVNAWYNGSILVEITLPIISYKIFWNDSNEHIGYFLKEYYFNIWIIHVQSPTNLPKSMWKLIFNVIDVILKFGGPKKKTHKVHMINDPCKALKKYAFGTKKLKNKKKLQLIWKYNQILKIEKSLIIKQWRFSKKRFFIWVHHLVLHYILSPNNKFGMWINIKFSILWCSN